MFDLDHPFFRHAWRRHGVVWLCIGWGAFEFLSGNLLWSLLFTGIGIVCAVQFRAINWSKYDDSAAGGT